MSTPIISKPTSYTPRLGRGRTPTAAAPLGLGPTANKPPRGGRVGLAFEDTVESSGLEPVLDQVGDYLRTNASGDSSSAFARQTFYGLFLGVGDSEFMCSPYNGNGTGTADRLVVDLKNLGALPEEQLVQLREAMRAHDAKSGPQVLSGVLSFEQLKALKLPRPEALVQDLVFEGETVLIAGRPKVGKTRLVHQLALDLEGATPFLGMNVPKRQRVLIIDLEDRPGIIQERLVRMAGKESSAPGLFIWCANSLSEDTINGTPEGVQKLRGMIEQTQAGVLIIDPWRLWLGKDENNAEEVVAGLRALSGLRASQPRLTILIVHHVRKERFESPRKLLADPRLWVESVSGHHALLSHVDSCYGLERQREQDGEEWIVFGGIARNTEPRTLQLEDEEETLRFDVRHSMEALSAILTPKEQEIWKKALELGEFGFNQLLKHSGTKTKKIVSSTLRVAKNHGLVVETDKGYRVTVPG